MKKTHQGEGDPDLSHVAHCRVDLAAVRSLQLCLALLSNHNDAVLLVLCRPVQCSTVSTCLTRRLLYPNAMYTHSDIVMQRQSMLRQVLRRMYFGSAADYHVLLAPAQSSCSRAARRYSSPPPVVVRVPLTALAMVVLMPPHRPLSEVMATATFLSTSVAAANDWVSPKVHC